MPPCGGWQGVGPAEPPVGEEGRLWDWAQARRGLRLRTLVLLRWALIAGETWPILWVQFGLGFDLPLLWCLLAILASAWLNLSVTLAWPGSRLAGRREAVVQLGFDLLQMSVLLGLTGGLDNPFLLMLIAPVAVAAATLGARDAAALCLLALAATITLAFIHLPLPWAAGETFLLPQAYRWGVLIAAVIGIVFTAAYAWQASAEASRMELALAATQAVLAREQRLSALGGLAAAAAHELGTPLATIQVVAKEMGAGPAARNAIPRGRAAAGQPGRALPRDPAQAVRAPDTSDEHHSRMSLSQLLDEVAEPQRRPPRS